MNNTTAQIKFGKLNINVNGLVTTIIGALLLSITCIVLGVLFYSYKQNQLNKKHSVIICPKCEHTFVLNKN